MARSRSAITLVACVCMWGTQPSPRWMSPDWFRFGASSLLNDVLMQIEFQRSGRYQDPDDFTLD